MKNFKKKLDNFITLLPYFAVQLSPIMALVIVLLMAYSISTSDMPDWFKFFLLK